MTDLSGRTYLSLKPRRFRPRALPMAVRLLFIGIILFGPVAWLEVHNARQDADQGIANALVTARLLVDQANGTYDDVINNAHSTLEVLAASPEGRGGTDCDAFMASLRDRLDWVTGIGIVGADGGVICNAPVNHAMNVSDRDYFKQAVASKQFTISNFHLGIVSRKPVITALLPILDSSRNVTRVAATAINLEIFNQMLAPHSTVPGLSVSLIDSAGMVIGRYPRDDSLIGRDMRSHPMVKSMMEGRDGTYQGSGLDGVDRIVAFRDFAGSPLMIAVGLPREEILKPVYDKLYRDLAGIGVVFAITFLLALATVHAALIRPARRLTQAAISIGEGDFAAIGHGHAPMGELQKVFVAFFGMAQRLQGRERELRRSEEKFKSIARDLQIGEQLANAGYWRMDYQAGTVRWSAGVYRIHGVEEANFTPSLENGIDAYHPEDRAKVIDALTRARALHQDFEFTLRIVRPDNEVRWIQSRGFCEIGPKGDVCALFGAIIDVTAQRQSEVRLQAARQTAEAASNAKSDFLSSMSHELRTPLTSIIGFSDLMLMRSRSKEMRDYLKLQRDAGQHLLMLINDILDHSKIEAGKLQIENIDFDLHSLVAGCLETMRNEAERKTLKLSHGIDVTVPRFVKGDPGRLRQVLLNLLGNALKFTEAGSVSVHVGLTGTAATVAALSFSVTDTGPGISHENVGKLFQRFSQADSSIARSHGGSGLGLSISRRLVEAMGGTMGVETRLGAGSKFWFRLRMLSSDAVHEAATPKPAAALRPSRVLLAEDSPINQMLFVELLRSLGHDVTAVSDGAAAVQAIRDDENFDVVLMDIHMPVMDGLEATQTIRSFANREIPIIGLTANAMQADIERCLGAGMNAHLAKPVDLTQLSEVIRRMTTA